MMTRSTASPVVAADASVRPQGYATAGDGIPVLMLHSSLASKSQWTDLAQRLAPRYRTIAVDLCGYGDNALPASRAPFSLDEEVRGVAALVDRLVSPRVAMHVVGHSYGGVVAMRLAHLLRARVASLSVYEPVAFALLDGDERADIERLAQRVARHVEEGRLHDATRTFVDFWSGDGSFARLRLPVQVRMAARIMKVPLDFRAASEGPLDAGAIVAPTLLLGGTRSPAVAQRIAMRLTRRLRAARAGWVDAGHMGPVTDANVVNPLIEAFIDARALHDRAEPAVRAAVMPKAWSIAAV
jgi:pimeloyl-ACP methyl ester carboxylesterase